MTDIALEELLIVAKANTKRGAKNYYRPLPKEQSKMIREYFKSKIDIEIDGKQDYQQSS